MGKYDGKNIVVTETKEVQTHGNVISYEIIKESYEIKGDKYYHIVTSNVTYEDGTTGVHYDKTEISKEEYEEMTKL